VEEAIKIYQNQCIKFMKHFSDAGTMHLSEAGFYIVIT
jgi:hypothetical protein